jgi:hypothetical protein
VSVSENERKVLRYKKIEDLVDNTALIKSLKEPEDKIGEPSPIRGNKFSHLSLEDFIPPDQTVKIFS